MPTRADNDRSSSKRSNRHHEGADQHSDRLWSGKRRKKTPSRSNLREGESRLQLRCHLHAQPCQQRADGLHRARGAARPVLPLCSLGWARSIDLCRSFSVVARRCSRAHRPLVTNRRRRLRPLLVLRARALLQLAHPRRVGSVCTMPQKSADGACAKRRRRGHLRPPLRRRGALLPRPPRLRPLLAGPSWLADRLASATNRPNVSNHNLLQSRGAVWLVALLLRIILPSSATSPMIGDRLLELLLAAVWPLSLLISRRSQLLHLFRIALLRYWLQPSRISFA